MPKKVAQPPSVEGEKQARQALENWQQAISNLYDNYTLLRTYLNQPQLTSLQTLPAKPILSQCPRSQLVKLVHRMRLELVRLIQDMECLDWSGEPVSPLSITQKLAVHTALVTQLNNQAQTRLHLIRQSVS